MFADSVTLGKLPAEYQVVEHLEDTGDPHNAALLSRGLGGAQKGDKKAANLFWEDTIGTQEMGKIKTALLADPKLPELCAICWRSPVHRSIRWIR